MYVLLIKLKDYYLTAWFETVVAFLILALVVGVAAGILYMVKPASAALQLVSGTYKL